MWKFYEETQTEGAYRNCAFSLSRRAAFAYAWFSIIRLASRERLADALFFILRFQYFSFFCSDGTRDYINRKNNTTASKRTKKQSAGYSLIALQSAPLI